MNRSPEIRGIIEVSAAVIQREDGTVLLAKRPPGKPWAGYWEFPGGKIEAGETPDQALVRELREELGITVTVSYPWITRIHTYPHSTVRLKFFRVTQWSGVLHPHEGQEFSWQPPSQVSVAPLLPANAPIIRALQLPDLYAISNVLELGETEFMGRLEVALGKGLRLVQLREKELRLESLRALSLKMLPLIKQYDARLIINSDIELAKEVKADGVQLTGKQLEELRERPDVDWCGASCHDAADLRRAEMLGCDFVLVSPVLYTLSHPNTAPLGWDKFSEMVTGAGIPVYALGGLSQKDMVQAWQHGAHGVAMVRHAW